jgi:predicted RNA-binding Zn ribbon-like protein
MAGQDQPYVFDLSGGALCLAFVNTVGDRPRRHEEHLLGWPDLVSWGVQAGAITPTEAGHLRAEARAHPRRAERGFARALGVREHLYELFSAAAARRSPDDSSVAALNEVLHEAAAHARLERRDGQYVWTFAGDGPLFARVTWQVSRSAADLLVSGALADLRECASGTCSWMFLDASPTRKRRWCSMKSCGNRAKARRHYHRQKHGIDHEQHGTTS